MACPRPVWVWERWAALLQLRLRKNAGQVEKPHLLRTYRKDIARLLTALASKKTAKAKAA